MTVSEVRLQVVLFDAVANLNLMVHVLATILFILSTNEKKKL